MAQLNLVVHGTIVWHLQWTVSRCTKICHQCHLFCSGQLWFFFVYISIKGEKENSSLTLILYYWQFYFIPNVLILPFYFLNELGLVVILCSGMILEDWRTGGYSCWLKLNNFQKFNVSNNSLQNYATNPYVHYLLCDYCCTCLPIQDILNFSSQAIINCKLFFVFFFHLRIYLKCTCLILLPPSTTSEYDLTLSSAFVVCCQANTLWNSQNVWALIWFILIFIN